MANLEGGSVQNFSGSMAEEMEKVMEAEMQALKGHGLPAMGRDERRVMLVAVARGMLNYLKIHEKDILRNIRLDPGAGDDIDAEVEDLEFGAEVQ
jgi:hypothetical protein